MIHSGVTESKRIRYWKDIAQGNAQIIIGTRSSLFFPYRNLGLIILDEEHDMSYISDSAPRYHVAEVAEYIATLNHIPLVYGSGTPRIETLYRALS